MEYIVIVRRKSDLMSTTTQKMVEFRLDSLLKRTKVKEMKELLIEDGFKRVLVLSPHFDDDVISCFGAISAHVSKNHKVDIIYITDGSASEDSGLSREELILLRKNETRNALEIISSKIDVYFLDEVDGEFQPAAAIIEYLGKFIVENKYDVIYCPHMKDGHRDHRMTALLLKLVLEKVSISPIIIFYEFWLPLDNPNCFVPINELEAKKRQAILCHESQIKYLDYAKLAYMVNSYRGKQIGAESCEVYEAMLKEEFLEKYKN